EVGVPPRVAGRLAAQQLQHFWRKLTRIHKRLENRLAQGVHGAVGIVAAELAPERVRVGTAREPRLQQEVGELIEQALEVDRVGQLGEVLRVGRRAHLPQSRGPGPGPQRHITSPASLNAAAETPAPSTVPHTMSTTATEAGNPFARARFVRSEVQEPMKPRTAPRAAARGSEARSSPGSTAKTSSAATYRR